MASRLSSGHEDSHQSEPIFTPKNSIIKFDHSGEYGYNVNTVAIPLKTRPKFLWLILPLIVILAVFIMKTVTKPTTADAQWKQLQEPSLGFTLQYPASFVVNVTKGVTLQQITFSENEDAASALLPPSVVVMIVPLPAGKSLREWIGSFGVVDADIQQRVSGQWTYLKWSEDGGLADNSATSFSTLLPDNRVLTFLVSSPTFIDGPALGKMLASVKMLDITKID